jgi:TPR repeat protein
MKIKLMLLFLLVCVGALAAPMPIHPCRVVNGKQYDLKALYAWNAARMSRRANDDSPIPARPLPEWIGGASENSDLGVRYRVARVLADGLVVESQTYSRTVSSGTSGWDDSFFLTNYPNMTALAENEPIQFFAIRSGRYNDGTITMRAYDYGTPCEMIGQKELTSEEVEEMSVKVATAKAKAKTDAEAKALKFNLDAAERGEAYGQFRMGMRYLHGEGVPQDRQKAREWLAKAAGQGHTQAKDELQKLTPFVP